MENAGSSAEAINEISRKPAASSKSFTSLNYYMNMNRYRKTG
jgi:hypothetical protein